MTMSTCSLETVGWARIIPNNIKMAIRSDTFSTCKTIEMQAFVLESKEENCDKYFLHFYMKPNEQN